MEIAGTEVGFSTWYECSYMCIKVRGKLYYVQNVNLYNLLNTCEMQMRMELHADLMLAIP